MADRCNPSTKNGLVPVMAAISVLFFWGLDFIKSSLVKYEYKVPMVTTKGFDFWSDEK